MLLRTSEGIMPTRVTSGRCLLKAIYRAFLSSPMCLRGLRAGIDLLHGENDPYPLNSLSVWQSDSPNQHPETLHLDDSLDPNACPTLRYRAITDHPQQLVAEFC